MGHSSFGPMWPNCDRQGRIVTLTRRDGLRLPIHRDLAPLVALLMDLTEARGYDIKPQWTWGYACRPIANTTTPSNHSQGTAVDINAPANPRRSDRRLVTDMPTWMVNLWKGHGFRWGGNFSWPDAMHFEFMGTAAEARATHARILRFLAAAGGATPPPPSTGRPTPVPYPGAIRYGDTGARVKVWQWVLRQRGYPTVADGVFGPVTLEAIRDWQRRHPPLKVDGVGGPNTWHSLLFA